MTLLQVAEANRLANIDQVYDQWHGYYLEVLHQSNPMVLGRKLTKEEAIAYRGDVEIVWSGSFSWGEA